MAAFAALTCQCPDYKSSVENQIESHSVRRRKDTLSCCCVKILHTRLSWTLSPFFFIQRD